MICTTCYVIVIKFDVCIPKSQLFAKNTGHGFLNFLVLRHWHRLGCLENNKCLLKQEVPYGVSQDTSVAKSPRAQVYDILHQKCS